MWDAIFADDPSLEIVDLICLNMLIRLHWERKQSLFTDVDVGCKTADL
jgi:hypothetical protein